MAERPCVYGCVGKRACESKGAVAMTLVPVRSVRDCLTYHCDVLGLQVVELGQVHWGQAERREKFAELVQEEWWWFGAGQWWLAGAVDDGCQRVDGCGRFRLERLVRLEVLLTTLERSLEPVEEALLLGGRGDPGGQDQEYDDHEQAQEARRSRA